MRGRTICIGIALLSCSTLLGAQQGLIGTYEGKFSEPVTGYGFRSVYSTLEITSAGNGKLAGKFKISYATFMGNPWCMGEYSIQGTYHESKLEMLTSEGTKRDCGKEPLVLAVQGNKLVGTISNLEIELVKK